MSETYPTVRDGRTIEMTVPDSYERVAPVFACPCCGEDRMDWLGWNSDGTVVTCAKCSADYDPCEV